MSSLDEIQLADSINAQAVNNMVEKVMLNGKHFNCGSVDGYIDAKNMFLIILSLLEIFCINPYLKLPINRKLIADFKRNFTIYGLKAFCQKIELNLSL